MFYSCLLILVISLGAVILLLTAYLKIYEAKAIFRPMKDMPVTLSDIDFPVNEIEIDVGSGVILSGWTAFSSGHKYTVLMFHGNAGNVSTRTDDMRILFDEGFNVIMVDYRGYGKSGGKPSEKSICSDVLKIYDYVTGRLGILPQRLIIYGRSLGAFFASYLAAQRDSSLLVLDCPFTCTVDMGTWLFPFLPGFFISMVVAAKLDTLRYASKVRSPKMIVHSECDAIVPQFMGRRIYEASLPPKRYISFDCGHVEALLTHTDVYIDEIKRCLL